MIKKIFFTLVNLISVLVIAAAVVVLLTVVLTKPGSPANRRVHGTADHDGKYGTGI